jgi:branched-chain amino acid transport system permease protein
VLLVWHGGQISPGTAGVGPVIDILIIAVVGGMSRPIGAFIGAIIYVNLRTFALDALVAVGLDGKRFQLLIGLGFLLIVLFSPDGILGLWARWRARYARADARDSAPSRDSSAPLRGRRA